MTTLVYLICFEESRSSLSCTSSFSLYLQQHHQFLIPHTFFLPGMSVDWYHRIASKFRYAPPTSPITSLVHLNCDSSIDLLDPSTPQGKTFDEICDALLENASHSPEKADRILGAAQVDRPEHVILFISESTWTVENYLIRIQACLSLSLKIGLISLRRTS